MIEILQETSTTTIAGSTSAMETAWIYDLAKIAVGAILGYLFGRLSTRKAAEDEFKRKHFQRMQDEVIKPMIEACPRIQRAVHGVVTNPELGLSLRPAEPASPLYEHMSGHFPDLIREWKALLQGTEGLHRDASSLTEEIVEEIRRRTTLNTRKSGELHYVDVDWRWNLYRYIASYRNRVELEDGDFRIRPTLVAQFKDLYELDVGWYEHGRNKVETLIFHAQGSLAEMESCKLALTEAERASRSKIDDLCSRRDELSQICVELQGELTEITYGKTLPRNCSICQ